jgi:peptidyl-prolyl cis-trans isomerase SurA
MDFKQNLRNQIITQKVIGEEVGSHLSITKEEAQKFYDQHKSELEQPETIRLSEILVAAKPADATATSAKTADANSPENAGSQSPPADPAAKQAAEEEALAAAKAKAEDLLTQIHKGAAFDDIAKKYSDGPSASQGGDLGVFKRGVLAKELEDKTFAMKEGDASDVIRTKQGYVILKVTQHQKAGVPEIKDVAPKIQDALYYEKLQPALRSYLTKLREEAYIDIKSGFLDTGASPNQTKPVETTTAKETDAKKLNSKKKKKLGIL